MTAAVLHDKPAIDATWMEFQSLSASCGIYRLDERAKIQLTGSDRVRWLNGMVSNNIRDLVVGRGVYAFLLNPQGRILGDLFAFNRGEQIVLDTDRTQAPKLLEVFDHYIIMDDVEVADVSEKVAAVGLSGPKSPEILKNGGFEVPELQPLEVRDLKWQETDLTLVRGEWSNYEIWSAPKSQDKVWEALVQSGAQPAGTSALEILRILNGVPRYGQDIRERDLPQETGQERALNYSKGCYIGQEIVERIRSRGAVHRTFVGFAIDGPLPAPGTKVQADGKEVGEITSAVLLPSEIAEHSAGLGYIRREFAGPSKKLSAGEAQATVRGLPFRGLKIL